MNRVSRRNFVKLLGFGGVSSAAALAGCGNGAAGDKASTTAAASTAAASTAAAEKPSLEAKQVYVEPSYVKDLIDGNLPESKKYVLLECSWGEEADSKDYTEGHIKGAVHMNTDNVESDEFWNFRTPEEFKELFTKFGITKDTVVVCYSSDVVNAADDRVALGFLWAGVENVKCLNGGLKAWTAAGYDTETTSNAPQETKDEFGVEIPAHPEYIISIDDVVKKLEDKSITLVSIRSWDEFIGKTSGYSYITRAGEPKGAIWGHDTDDGSYAKDEKMVDSSTIEEYISAYDAKLTDTLAFYCGTGWRAAMPWLIMYQEGFTNMLFFDGGWNQWQMNPDLPVQVGDPKSSDVVYTTVSELPTDKAKLA